MSGDLAIYASKKRLYLKNKSANIFRFIFINNVKIMQKILAIKNKKDYNLSQVERENVQRVSQMWLVFSLYLNEVIYVQCNSNSKS